MAEQQDNKENKKTAILKRLTRFVIGSAAIAMALLVFVQIAFWGAIAWVNSSSGQSFIESSLGGQLEGSSYHVKVGGFSYIFPTLSRVGLIELYKGDELILSAKSISLDLDVFPISRKKLIIDLNVGEFILYAQKDKKSPDEAIEETDIFPVIIKRFDLPDIYFTRIEIADISVHKFVIKGKDKNDIIISPHISGEILLTNKQDIKIDLTYQDKGKQIPEFLPHKIDMNGGFNTRRAALEIENFALDADIYAVNANMGVVFRKKRDFKANTIIRLKNIDNITPLELRLSAVNKADFSVNIALLGAYFEKQISLNSNISFSKGKYSLGNIKLIAPDLAVSGNVNYDSSIASLGGRLSGRLERLNAYQNFIGAGHELEPANFEVLINGETLKINAKSNGYANKSYNLNVKNINLEAMLDKQLLTIKKLTLQRSESDLFISKGSINLADKSVNLTIKAENFEGIKGDIANGTINADISLKGNNEGYYLSGVISPKKIEVKIPEQFSSSIPELNIKKKGDVKKANPPDMAKKIALDLIVDAPRQILVRGWGLDAEFGGKIEVKGSAYKPEFYGDFKVLRGRYSEFGKKFKITKAKMKFSGTIPPSPTFDIVTQSKVDDIIAKVLIGGSVLKPKITFSSDPALPQDEVMSKILFGEDMKNLSPFQAVKLAGTMKRFSGTGGGAGMGSSFDPIGSIKSATGLDDLRVETDASGGASVGAGKYLSEKVYLEFEAGSEEGSGNANVQVEVTPNITVESEIGQDARGGAGIFWKRDY